MTTYSLTRRLTMTVLALELSMGVALVSIAAVHEWHVRMGAFDVMVQGRADTLFGAVEDAEDEQDNVILDMSGITVPKGDVYRVRDEKGRLLGKSTPAVDFEEDNGWFRETIGGTPYRLVQFRGVRIIDPGRKDGGVRHTVMVLYGASTNHVRHEVLEAVRFDSSVLLALVVSTALLMVWLLRRELAPLHQLAQEAEGVTAQDWQFLPPEEARRLRELRPLAEAIETTLQRLQRSFEQQRRFTSDAAHELKTEVAIAKSSLQLLTMKLRTPEEYEQGLEVCLEDCRRLERMVLEMLAYARVEHQGGTVKVGACSLMDCVAGVVRQTHSIAEMRGVGVTMQGEVLQPVGLDPHDCSLLCINLVMNALEHTGRGKRVVIEMGSDAAMATLVVRDEGEGIAETDLEHIFEPFYRPDTSRDRKSGGTGLGLSICEGICRQVGGSIAIESKMGVGTSVTVRVPLVGDAVRPVDASDALALRG